MLYSIVLIFLIILSAFFSSAETSLLSLNKNKLKHSKNKKDKRADILLKILEEPDYFFSTILIGNNLVNIAAASLFTILISRYIVGDEELLMFYSTFITTILILVFAEIIPKSYAIRESEKLAYIYAWPLRFFMIIFYLPSKMFAVLSYFLFSKNKSSKEKGLNRDEFKLLLESEAKFLKYKPDTLKMIHEIIDIAGKDAKSVMTPRIKMFAINVSLEHEDLKQKLLNNNYSKIPIYEGNLDNIVGIFEINSLVKKVLLSDLKKIDIESLAIKPFFVSEYSSLDYIMQEFKSRKVNIAIVLDEYASVAGVVTVNDIFRELMGGLEIKSTGIKKIKQNTWILKGDSNVFDVNNHLNISLPLSKEYSSVGGLFIYTHGSLPVKGDKLSIGNYSLTVSATDKKSVKELKLNIGGSTKND